MENQQTFTWRRAGISDAQIFTDIYNETIDGGGHSPKLRTATVEAMQHTLRMAARMGWPIWAMTSHDQVAGWACIRPMAWGPEVCHRTGDLSIYVPTTWQGSGVAMQAIFVAYHEAPRHGFDAVSCWILSSNCKSTMLARACRLQRWGLMPRAACYGDRVDDVEIWGCRFDDAQWTVYMDTLEARITRRRVRSTRLQTRV
jgi:L-amino acid N-acyltransferase YncA